MMNTKSEDRYFMVLPFVCLMILSKEGKVLINKRGNKCEIYAGYNELPGGKIEPFDQDAFCAAFRECVEETGKEPQSLDVLDIKLYGMDRIRKRPGLAIILKTKIEGDPFIREEEKDIIESQTWLTKEQALDLQLTPWSRYAITRFL